MAETSFAPQLSLPELSSDSLKVKDPFPPNQPPDAFLFDVFDVHLDLAVAVKLATVYEA